MSQPQFAAKTFAQEIKKAVDAGQATLELLLDAYDWSEWHYKEIHDYTPDWSQSWLAAQIRRLFNVDAQLYKRTLRKLGGGTKQSNLQLGRQLIRQFGPALCFKAERHLNVSQIAALHKQISGNTTADEFDCVIEELAAIKAGRGPKQDAGTRINYKQECVRLQQEIAVLKKENSLLRRQLKQFEVVAVKKKHAG